MYSVDIAVVVICIAVVKYLLDIHAGKKVWKGNLFRASSSTVTTGCTGNREGRAHFFHPDIREQYRNNCSPAPEKHLPFYASVPCQLRHPS